MAESYSHVPKDAQVAVVMVPLPAQGHINQLLHLSRLISEYNIPVHYVGTTTLIRQAKLRAHGFDPLRVKNIHFREFIVPPFETPPPNSDASNKFPNQLIPSILSTIHLREPVCTLVRQLCTNHRKVIVIYDATMSLVVQDVPTTPNAECYCFNSNSAFYTHSFYWEAKGKPFQAGTELYEDIPSVIENCLSPEMCEFLRKQEHIVKKISSGEIFNSSRVIEGLYLDLIAKEWDGLKIWAIGPFTPLFLSEQKHDSKNSHPTLDWLDKQEPYSVIYVSFGTTTSLSNEEVKEVAMGLEKSLHKFIWVLRYADRGDIFAGEERKAQLPEGYEERIKGRGVIVRDWAPQLEILAHPSTGGFMSHCGWNSCMESISMGVPIAAWPMHSDQPRNSQLVTKFLRIGLNVRHWARREELVTSEIIEKAVTTLIASPEGDEMRKRASQLRDAVKESVMDGGVNRVEMESFIVHITR